MSLAKMPEQPLAVAPSPAEMMQAMIKCGVTENNVAAFEKLAELQWKFDSRDAEREFNAAFERFQDEKPVIVASTPIKNRGAYEKYEDIMQKCGVEKLLTKNGFTVSFDQSAAADRITVTCTLAHRRGHKISKSYSTRTKPADNLTQSDSMATTTAKRNSLCLALNIVIRQDALQDEDNDASLVGNQSDVVAPEQADELERRVALLNFTPPQVSSFLKFYGGETCKKYAEIPASKYGSADTFLAGKERAVR